MLPFKNAPQTPTCKAPPFTAGYAPARKFSIAIFNIPDDPEKCAFSKECQFVVLVSWSAGSSRSAMDLHTACIGAAVLGMSNAPAVNVSASVDTYLFRQSSPNSAQLKPGMIVSGRESWIVATEGCKLCGSRDVQMNWLSVFWATYCERCVALMSLRPSFCTKLWRTLRCRVKSLNHRILALKEAQPPLSINSPPPPHSLSRLTPPLCANVENLIIGNTVGSVLWPKPLTVIAEIFVRVIFHTPEFVNFRTL